MLLGRIVKLINTRMMESAAVVDIEGPKVIDPHRPIWGNLNGYRWTIIDKHKSVYRVSIEVLHSNNNANIEEL